MVEKEFFCLEIRIIFIKKKVILLGIHRKGCLEFYQLWRYLETIFFYYSSFEVDSYSFSIFFLDSRNNYSVANKKQRIDS